MKATELIEKLNVLVKLKSDANVYFYISDDTIEDFVNKLSMNNRLSDIGIVLSRTYEGGEGLISNIPE